ncbi:MULTISPECIES: hypothetical protein [Kaistia]|nr:hypothetical protein [Kaistia nematophila]
MAIGLLVAIHSTALAAEPTRYVPTGPLSVASMKGVSNFYEWTLRWVSWDRQMRLGLDGREAEVCANQQFARYGQADAAEDWPFNVDWKNPEGWTDLPQFHTEIGKRSKYDELQLRLCLKDAVDRAVLAASVKSMTEEEREEIVSEDVAADADRMVQLSEDLGLGREFVAYCSTNLLKLRNEASASGVHSKIPLGQWASDFKDPDELRVFVKEIRDYGWSYYQLCMRDAARQMQD